MPTGLRILLAAAFVAAAAALAQGADTSEKLQHLVAAYPEQLDRIDGSTLVWRDGTRMELDDGKGVKDFEALIADPDIEDMLALPYPAGGAATPPEKNFDPGRTRNLAFFNKMYGDCQKDEVAKNLTEIVWMPKKAPQRLMITKVNGVDEKLAAVSAELDLLPGEFDVFLIPSAGTYNCRVIAGTDRPSAHGHGIAIDIATRHADYWRWLRSTSDGSYIYRNRIPMEIVRIFEKHGFIWGGRWYHFDTMHFEYRPELLP
jgi:D-alanyl-D-alanine carboxypeptidase